MATSAKRESARVARHLWRAEQVAARSKLAGLSPVQRVVRSLLLAELRRYRVAGRFPKNPQFREPTPFFVDGTGTRCAVAHLLELGGERELVQRIARERNNARVVELADEPRLVAWLDAAGLTLGEAALIQPAYCGLADASCVCSNRATGYLEVSTTTYPRDGLALAEVKVIHGVVDAGIEVGSEIQVESYASDVPVQMVVQGIAGRELDGGTPVYRGIQLGADGRYSCGWSGPITKQQYLQAVQAQNCPETLESFESWKNECDDGCGCRAVGRAQPSPTGILLALLGVVLARRMARPRARAG